MQKLKQLAPYLAGWALLIVSSNFTVIGLANGLSQLPLFLVVVCIPAWRTERMSYVDIGWPWGLVVIGVFTLTMGEGDAVRVAMVVGLYVFMGGRMGIFVLKLWRNGALERELPRYRYQAVRWERSGELNIPVVCQKSAEPEPVQVQLLRRGPDPRIRPISPRLAGLNWIR